MKKGQTCWCFHERRRGRELLSVFPPPRRTEGEGTGDLLGSSPCSEGGSRGAGLLPAFCLLQAEKRRDAGLLLACCRMAMLGGTSSSRKGRGRERRHGRQAMAACSACLCMGKKAERKSRKREWRLGGELQK